MLQVLWKVRWWIKNVLKCSRVWLVINIRVYIEFDEHSITRFMLVSLSSWRCLGSLLLYILVERFYNLKDHRWEAHILFWESYNWDSDNSNSESNISLYVRYFPQDAVARSFANYLFVGQYFLLLYLFLCTMFVV